MGIGLDQLAKWADEAEAMPRTDELRGQCARFALYAESVRWHYSVRKEAKDIARRLKAVALKQERTNAH